MRFNDEGYLKAYYEQGEYPKIHNDIYNLSSLVHTGLAIDIGSCYGLLSVRLTQNFDKVIGLEPNKNYFKNSIQHERVEYINQGIDFDNLSDIGKIVKENDTTIVARRVFPEIYETGGYDLIEKTVQCFYDNGAKYIVLEGRKKSSNATNPLHSVRVESKLFTDSGYKLIHVYHECRLLELV